MTPEEGLFAFLTADAGVSALVATRVYPNVAAQDASLPYIVYQRISTPRVGSHSGPSGLAHPRFQLTCADDSYSGAKALADSVRSALDGYIGMMGGGSGVGVQATYVKDERDGYDSTSKVQVKRLDVVLWHKE